MKKLTTFITLSLLSLSLFAESKAADVIKEASKKSKVSQSVEYLNTEIKNTSSSEDKRALYIFLGSLYEQLGQYDDARAAYVNAAGIKGGTAEGTVKRTNEELVLSAVRCALNCGDAATAESYLNSTVRNSKDEKILAHVKLYAQWAALIQAQEDADLEEPIAVLKAYAGVKSMQVVQPAIMLTLWHITGEKSYGDELVKKYPSSLEAGIVKGDVQMMSTPFWLFVPKKQIAEVGTGSVTVAKVESSAAKTEAANSSNNLGKLHLGLFKTESNASRLVEELKKKGFDAYQTSETRSSGTTYFIVLVTETDSSTADKLRSAGYECYRAE